MIAAIVWDNLASLPVAILGTLALLTVLAWAYRPQIALLHPALRWALPLLRSIAIVALLASLLKPVIATTATQAQRGAVVMVVDASLSMGLTDVRRPADRVALARALGRLPPRADDALATVAARLAALSTALDEWRRTQDEVRFAAATGRSTKDVTDRATAQADGVARARDAVIALAGAGKHADLAAALRALSGVAPGDLRSRVSRAASELAKARAREDGSLYQSDPTARAAADAVASASRVQLAGEAAAWLARQLPQEVPVYAYAASNSEVAAIGLSPGAATDIAASAYRSDPTAAIVAALRRVGAAPVRGVVLLSDGREVDADPETPRTALPPVLAVNVVPAPPRDLSLSIVEAPDRMFVGESATVRVAVQVRGMSHAPIDVQLRSGTTTETRKALPDAHGRGVVDFSIKPQSGGLLELTAQAPPQPEEITAANNVAAGRVRVLTDKLKVVAYAGSPTWDFQYLRNALQRCAWVELSEGIIGVMGVKFPLSPQQILEQNVVVLSDVAVDTLDAAQWDALNALVQTRGGSVIVMANDARTLDGYAAQPQAANLLPLRPGLSYSWRVWSGERPTLRVVPADVGSLPRWLSDDPAESARRWQSAGALFRVMPLAGLRPNAQPLLVEAESRVPVVTDARMGAGRVLFVGLNETWRWRFKVGERDQDRFWLQLVRHAGDEPYAAHTADAALDASAAAVRPGQPVTLRARVRASDGNPAGDAKAVVHVKRDGEPAPTVELPAIAPAGLGRYEATVTDLPAGHYEFTLATPGSATGPSLVVLVEPDRAAELLDTSADVAFLQRLAETTGGTYAGLADLDEISATLESTGTDRNALVQRPLWDSPYLFALVLACLGTEWALRKRAGLA